MLKTAALATCTGHHRVSGERSSITVTGDNSKLQGLKVLVIDDSKTIRRTAETLLAKEDARSTRR